MKKTISYLIFVLVAVPLFAQKTNMIDKKVEQMVKIMELSDEQAALVKDILIREQQDIRKLFKEQRASGQRGGRREAVQQRRQVTDAQIMNILEDDQVDLYEEYKANAITDEQTLELMDRLKLSEQQAREVQQIYRRQREEMREMRSSANGDFSRMREIMQKKRQETDQAIEALLNAEQKKEFEQFKKERQERFRQRMPRRQRN